ncbi:amino acid ABC transporter substrate-binding protein [Undibacterium sp. CY18W]|uniref:Amino acid ABC transporter substrate-binding protein n=1 Tax=Undibacterium hunanense TaxID=2762292 RepID=A0ABR6ZSX4_9BURK|nr:transporter substrate-binding domain-containing protein [Undibacterium hunanense]MBC3919003.1 amino acid ABC transporter substrate-binding protein [Undibacterium hunanense]
MDSLKRRFLFIFLSVALSATTSAAEPTLTMLVGTSNAPKMFLNDAEKPVGYFTELAQLIGRRAGYKVVIVAVPWARAVQMAERGEGVICSLSKTPEREMLFNYSNAVLVDRVVIVTLKKRNLVAASLADLKGMTIGVNRGSKYGTKYIEELPMVNLDEDNSGVSRLRKLVLGRIDAAIIPGGVAAVTFNAKMAGIDFNDLTVQKTPLAIDKNYFGISKSRPDASDVLGHLNAAIDASIADGSIEAIMNNYGGMP